MKTRTPLIAVAAVLVATLVVGLVAGVGADESQDAPRYWRDDPASNEYGPQTGVVWASTWEAETYHRLMCPKLREECGDLRPLPRARHGVEECAQPCTLCKP